MTVEIVTNEDLQFVKEEIIREIRELLNDQPHQSDPSKKQYLKTHQVLEMLGVSPGTLQTLRDNGTVPFYRIGGTILYDMEEIQQLIKVSRAP